MLDQLLPFIGFLVGLLVGLTGAGGGAILTPVLVLLGVPAAAAVGSDLLFNGAVKSLGSFLHFRRGNVDSVVLLPLLLGGAPAVLLGYWLITLLREFYSASSLDSFLTLAIGVVLLAAGSMVLAGRRRWGSMPGRRPGFWKTAAVGTGVAAVVQMTSVGSGTMLLPYLANTDLAPRKAVGTDVAYGLAISLIAGLSHLGLGDVQPLMLALLLAGALPGTLLGVALTSRVDGASLRAGVGIFVFASGIALLLRLLQR